ncbi:hypothetical protein MRB53_038202 [Persea americana]|nr:hypothetical protein MRB53_038202 [Persea americana]
MADELQIHTAYATHNRLRSARVRAADRLRAAHSRPRAVRGDAGHSASRVPCMSQPSSKGSGKLTQQPPNVSRDGITSAMQWTAQTLTSLIDVVRSSRYRSWQQHQQHHRQSPPGPLKRSHTEEQQPTDEERPFVKRQRTVSYIDPHGVPPAARPTEAFQGPASGASDSAYEAQYGMPGHSVGSRVVASPSDNVRQQTLPSPPPSTSISLMHARHHTTSPMTQTPHNPAAEASYLQEMQHQVSMKTIALRTLNREHEHLLKKLERQQTKCVALERKFEVSDVELNAAVDEKERQQAQILELEAQVTALQKSREELRSASAADGGQYLRIMELCGKIQEKSAEEKRKWMAEKASLEQRLESLTKSKDRVSHAEEAASDAQVRTEQDVTNAAGPPVVEATAAVKVEASARLTTQEEQERLLMALRENCVETERAAATARERAAAMATRLRDLDTLLGARALDVAASTHEAIADRRVR